MFYPRHKTFIEAANSGGCSSRILFNAPQNENQVKEEAHSAFLEALVRNFINKYTRAYELIAKIATTPMSRQP